MFSDRLIAICALVLLLAFLSVLVMWVPRVDMTVVIGIVVLLVLYDFFRDLGPGRGKQQVDKG
ncbi:hypothetical protein [Aquibaculum arenosum]|uniref:Uncharacterized protein n=1 Tax=Aquibaculum arenosum TaxID=3032591 RepID=A0ABT5YKK3_9PROT|nr:hypothetical protein [Fodinicurvata sp. CAU 1616]MDF2095438.1 hypothetical protein [Fodinicurvata sp. CAU 1616]